MTGILRRLASLIASASLLVSMTNTRSGTPPMSLMPPSAFSSLSFSRVSIRRSFLVRPLAPSASMLVELAQPRDRAGDRLPVGQRAAEPAGIDEILRAALGRLGHLVGRLPLGADEQHAPALGDGIGDDLQRLMQQRHRLGEVDDVDGVARAVDVGGHFRVPAMRLVAEMRAGFEKLTHGEIRQRQAYPFRLSLGGACRRRRPSAPERTLEAGRAKLRLWNGAGVSGKRGEWQA